MCSRLGQRPGVIARTLLDGRASRVVRPRCSRRSKTVCCELPSAPSGAAGGPSCTGVAHGIPAEGPIGIASSHGAEIAAAIQDRSNRGYLHENVDPDDRHQHQRQHERHFAVHGCSARRGGVQRRVDEREVEAEKAVDQDLLDHQEGGQRKKAFAHARGPSVKPKNDPYRRQGERNEQHHLGGDDRGNGKRCEDDGRQQDEQRQERAKNVVEGSAIDLIGDVLRPLVEVVDERRNCRLIAELIPSGSRHGADDDLADLIWNALNKLVDRRGKCAPSGQQQIDDDGASEAIGRFERRNRLPPAQDRIAPPHDIEGQHEGEDVAHRIAQLHIDGADEVLTDVVNATQNACGETVHGSSSMMLANGVELTGFSAPHSSVRAYAKGPHGAFRSRFAHPNSTAPSPITAHMRSTRLDKR